MKSSLDDLLQGGIGELGAKMAQCKAEISQIRVEGESGAGMVKIIMTGDFDVVRVKIDPSLAENGLDVVEDLVAAAVRDAVRRVKDGCEEKMNQLTSEAWNLE